VDHSTNVMPKRRADIPPHAAAKKMSALEALDLLPAQIAVLDPQGGIVFTNQVWDETAEGRLARRRWNYLEECRAAAERGCSEGRVVGEGIARILRREVGQFVATYSCPFDRRHHWFQISARPPRASDEGIGAIVMHTDVSALQHDHLTGLANRALFDSQTQYALDTARQSGSRVGLALIDLDGFKPINDQFGHAAGDKVLVEIAQRLSSAADSDALVARLGGDEFGVVTWLGCDEVALGRLARKIQLAFKQPYLVGGSKCYLSASIGTALYPVDGETLEALLKSADGRMYGLKRATKNRHEKWMA
jgi:diguanylate cyclase (GGDEF)-like protein